MKIAAIWVLLLFGCLPAMSQGNHNGYPRTTKTDASRDSTAQLDAIDILRSVLHVRKQRTVLRYGTALYSILPGVSYTSVTGFSPSLAGNLVYYPSADPKQNLSTLYGLAAYGQHLQQTYWVYSNIWTPHNTYNFPGNAWLLKYTETTYGLGSHSASDKRDPVSYNYLRVHESALKNIVGDLSAGFGYALDYHYNIRELGTKGGAPSALAQYQNASKTISSGPTVQVLYDCRRNTINPYAGAYASVVYGPKLQFLGSDQNWQSLSLDLRKYVPVGGGSRNVLAFWGLAWLTVAGTPPYFDLPSIQWDDLQHTGRGYVQGRYRGRDMAYLEGEYRFAISRNGLFGGVMFANAQSYTGGHSNLFTRLLPAAGAGVRIKINKYSRTNLCLDYAVGADGSRGFFFNLGEIF